MMAADFRASEMWRKINEEVIGDPEKIDLSSFRAGGVSSRISDWDANRNGLRFYKTLLFNTAMSLDSQTLAKLDRIAIRDLGRPVQVSVRGRKICMDYLQCVCEADFLETELQTARTVLEIGPGYGRTCHTILSLFDNIESYTVVDLLPCLGLSRRYLERVLEEERFAKIRFVDARMLDAERHGTFDLVINIDSMAEMEPDVVRSYLDFIDRSARGFYTKNPLGKYKPESIGHAAADSGEVSLALATGPLRQIIDIFDDDSIARARPAFIEGYQPSPDWQPVKNGYAPPWSYYHQVFYARTSPTP